MKEIILVLLVLGALAFCLFFANRFGKYLQKCLLVISERKKWTLVIFDRGSSQDEAAGDSYEIPYYGNVDGHHDE